ncbi:MAG: apolipoprotein N-acyltransferase [Acetobacteraceae bacterium]|nr:apolipoprotein N-acyltransferase [Acetobacteraceae bacterium]
MIARITRHLRGRTGWRASATALGLGVLAALALPPLHAVPLLWLAIPGLLVLVEAAPSWRAAGVRAFAFGLGHHLAGLFWITDALIIEAERAWFLIPVAVPAVAGLLALFIAPAGIAAFLARPGWRRVLAFAGAWSLGELARTYVLTGFPWNLVATVWAFAALPMQISAWVGVHGLSLASVLVAALPVLGARGFFAACVLLAAGGAAGVARLWPAEPPPLAVALRIVQGNIAQAAKWDDALRARHFRKYLALTANAPAAGPGETMVVIWPETASPYLLASDPAAQQAAAAALPEGGLLLAGTVRVERGPALRVFNSLVVLDANGVVRDVFDKAHLVPFGEYVPLRDLLPLPRLVRATMDFSAGPGRRSIDPGIAGVPAFSPLICYEAIFPGQVVDAGSRPGWLVNITNDAWFGRLSGPWQHLAAARFRSVEEGLPLARAANTGISALFDARGREVARLGLGATGVIAAPLPAPLPPTLFAQTGVWLPASLAVFALFCGLTRRKVALNGMETSKKKDDTAKA